MERVKRAKLAELFRKDYVQTVIMVVIMVGSVFAFWYGLGFVFKTEQPLFYVDGTSMLPTLQDGDLILVQGVQNACKIHAASKDANPPGDILIFHSPLGGRIVHRAVEKIIRNGHCYFRTQGDNEKTNPTKDPWEVRESDIVGKYTGARVPLLGYIFMFFEPLYVKVALILLWIILLIISELVPLLRKKVKGSQTETKPL